MIFPVERELEFLLWIEQVKLTLPADALFQESLNLHQVYHAGGLALAVEWLEHMIVHPAGKGHGVPIFARGYNHVLIALMTAGLENPLTRDQTKELILQRVAKYQGRETDETTE